MKPFISQIYVTENQQPEIVRATPIDSSYSTHAPTSTESSCTNAADTNSNENHAIQNIQRDCTDKSLEVNKSFNEKSKRLDVPNKRCIKRFSCRKCNIKFESKAESVEHKQKVHSQKFQCDYPDCKQILDQKRSLNNHKRLVHKYVKGAKFQCPVKRCGISFLQQNDLDYHMEGHKNNKLFECSQCNNQFTSKANKIRHKQNAHKM